MNSNFPENFDAKKHYIGAPCRYASTGVRWISDRKCICEKCAVAKAARSKVRRQLHTKNNLERIYAASLKWQRDNPERYQATRQEWRNKNRDIKISYDHQRRAMKLKALPSWYGEFDRFVMRQAADLCGLRAAATGFAWQVDHMIPLQAVEACGLHVAANFQVIPASLNSSKSNKMILTEPGQWIGAI